MRNLRLEVEYDGTDYHGWQYQPDRVTIQGTIEAAIEGVLGERVRLIGAARTDAGVHARAQVANFLCRSELPAEPLRRAINRLLPPSIYIRKLCEAPERFHARYGALYKVYEYRIVRDRSPLRHRYAWELRYRLDLNAMAEAEPLFLSHRDYGKFCGLRVCDPKVNLQRVGLTDLTDEIRIEIVADRFLYKQVRRMVGAMVDLGRGRRGIEELAAAMEGRPHRPFTTAPAKGLTLVGIGYQ